MTAGRPRKAPERAQGHRRHTTSTGRELSVVPPSAESDGAMIGEVLAPIPSPPATVNGVALLPEVLLKWDAYWLSPLVQALDSPDGIDVSLVMDWIRLENELIVVEQIAQKQRVVVGSTGQPRATPLLAERNAIRQQLKELRVQLGIGPKNRAQLGIELAGAISAVDRMNRQLNAAERGEEYDPEDDYEELTVPELQIEARLAGVAGPISRMRRAELIEAIEAVGE